MRKTLIYAILILLLFSSCLTNKEGFTVYKNKNNFIPLKLNGVFYLEDGYDHDNIVLYSNGLCFYYQNYWGAYSITNDTILIQYFHVDQQNFYSKNIMELYGMIESDTSILIYKKRCDWCENVYSGYKNKKERMYKPPRLYIFKERVKQDSTNAWFLDKKWYLKGIESKNLK